MESSSTLKRPIFAAQKYFFGHYKVHFTDIWNTRILDERNIGYQKRKSLLTPFLLLNPSFQYSTIPTFHVVSS